MSAVITQSQVPSGFEDPIFTPDAANAILQQPYHLLFTAGEAGAGGHLLASLMPGTMADILTLYVPPAARRHGNAKALLEAMLASAKAQGCLGLTLEVNATNTAAIALYTVCGLQQVATRANYYPIPVSNLKADALVLALTFA